MKMAKLLDQKQEEIDNLKKNNLSGFMNERKSNVQPLNDNSDMGRYLQDVCLSVVKIISIPRVPVTINKIIYIPRNMVLSINGQVVVLKVLHLL